MKETIDERSERVRREMSSEKYPMKPDNPLYNATDDETRAYIRKRRAEFGERHKNDPPRKERK